MQSEFDKDVSIDMKGQLLKEKVSLFGKLHLIEECSQRYNLHNYQTEGGYLVRFQSVII